MKYKKSIQNIIFNIKKKFPNINIEDLKQQAWLAINEAKKHFDPKKGNLSNLTKTWVYRELLKYAMKNINILSSTDYDRVRYTHRYIESTNSRIGMEVACNTLKTNFEKDHDFLFEKEIQGLLKKSLGERGYNILVDRFLPMTLQEIANKYQLNSTEQARIEILKYFSHAKDLVKAHKEIYEWST